MNVAELSVFLNSPKVMDIGFQGIEIEVLFNELHSEILKMTKEESLHPWLYLVRNEKAKREYLGSETNTRVENLIKEVLLNSGIDLTPEYLKAIGKDEGSSVVRFPVQLRLA